MAEVYEMMMRLGLEGSAMAGLANISSVLSNMHKKVGEVEKGFTNWQSALVGVGSIIGGALILGGIEKVIQKTKGLSDELAKLQKLGGDMAPSVISGEMTAKAFDISKRVGMNVVDLLKIPGQMYSMIGKDESDRIWEPLAKYAFSQRSDAGFTASSENKLQSLVRAGEAMGRVTDIATGQIDPAKLEHWLDLAQQIKSATHGTVNEEVLLGMAKQLGPAGRSMTDEGMMSLAVAAQVLGGPRTGTAIMSTWQQLAAGTMLKRSALGLSDPAIALLRQSEYEVGKGGQVTITDEASKRLTELISHDPLELARQMRNQLISEGVTDPAEQMRKVMRAMGRATTQRFTAEEVANFEQIMSEKGRMGKGYGSGQSFDTSMAKSISANEEALKQAWENLQFAVAGPQSENVIIMLKSLTGFINSMTESVRGMDPKTLTSLGTGIAAIGVGLIGAGGAALLAALGPAGWFVLGVVSLGTAFAANMFGIRSGMATMEAAIAGLAKSEWAHIVNGFNTIRDAIASFFSFLSGFKWSGNPFAAKADPLITGSPQKKGWEDWPGLSHSGGMSPIPFHKSSFEGDTGGARLIPANFNPGQKKQVLQPITLSLNLDGRTLGQAVSEVLEDLYTHPTGPPQANGWDHFRPQGNFSDT